MSFYRVKWEIGVDADTPEEAAELARTIQQDKENTATFYLVKDLTHGKRAKQIQVNVDAREKEL